MLKVLTVAVESCQAALVARQSQQPCCPGSAAFAPRIMESLIVPTWGRTALSLERPPAVDRSLGLSAVGFGHFGESLALACW